MVVHERARTRHGGWHEKETSRSPQMQAGLDCKREKGDVCSVDYFSLSFGSYSYHSGLATSSLALPLFDKYMAEPWLWFRVSGVFWYHRAKVCAAGLRPILFSTKFI